MVAYDCTGTEEEEGAIEVPATVVSDEDYRSSNQTGRSRKKQKTAAPAGRQTSRVDTTRADLRHLREVPLWWTRAPSKDQNPQECADRWKESVLKDSESNTALAKAKEFYYAAEPHNIQSPDEWELYHAKKVHNANVLMAAMLLALDTRKDLKDVCNEALPHYKLTNRDQVCALTYHLRTYPFTYEQISAQCGNCAKNLVATITSATQQTSSGPPESVWEDAYREVKRKLSALEDTREADLAAQKEKMERTHVAEIDKLKSAHAAEIGKLKSEHATQLRKHAENLKADKEKAKSAHVKERGELEDKLRNEVKLHGELKTTLEKEKSKYKRKCSEALEQQRKHSDDLEKQKSEVKRNYDRNLKAATDKFNKATDLHSVELTNLNEKLGRFTARNDFLEQGLRSVQTVSAVVLQAVNAPQ